MDDRDPGLEQAATQPDANPFASSKRAATASKRWLAFTVGIAFIAFLAVSTGSAQSVWQVISQFIGLHGEPEPASANVLSEHEIEVLDQMSPQAQAQLLLERSINHYRGANDEIAKRVNKWQGNLKLEGHLESLFGIAIDSDDLRVRAAALEMELAAMNMQKSAATMDGLEHNARFGEQRVRMDALWYISVLGNRGVEPQRAFEIVSASVHDSDEFVRSAAVNGLAYLGTDETIAPLLEVFHDDPSPTIRERAACGLAQSGMLSERQRRTTVPKLLDYAEDPSLDPTTRSWVFQALRDITGQSLPHDAAVWRKWYNNNSGNWNPVTRDSE